MPVVYSLTELTGRNRNENRRIVVVTFEVKRRTFIVSCASVLASLPFAGIVGLFFGVAAIIVPFVFIGLGLWLWDSRQRKGMRLLNYQAIIDTRKAKNGVLYAAGQPVPEPVLVMHQRQFVPVIHPERAAPAVLSVDNPSNARAKRKGRRSKLRVQIA